VLPETFPVETHQRCSLENFDENFNDNLFTKSFYSRIEKDLNIIDLSKLEDPDKDFNDNLFTKSFYSRMEKSLNLPIDTIADPKLLDCALGGALLWIDRCTRIDTPLSRRSPSWT
jgi:hypothetical protein